MMAQAAGLLPMMVNRAGTTSSAALILLALAGGQEHQLDEYLSELLDVFLKVVTSISSPPSSCTNLMRNKMLSLLTLLL